MSENRHSEQEDRQRAAGLGSNLARAVSRGVGLSFVWLVANGLAYAQVQISIGDVKVVEGDPTGTTQADFSVTLSAPSAGTVTSSWATKDGTAIAPADYAAAAGVVTFLPGVVSQTVTVDVARNVAVESDRAFYVDLSSPTGGALLKRRGVGTILDDDAVNPGVAGIVVVSDGGVLATSGRNRLEWRNPIFASAPALRIRWNQRANPCAVGDYPANPSGPSDGLVTPDVVLVGSHQPQIFEHTGGTLGTNYCYTVWVEYPGPAYSAGSQATGRPFDSMGPVKWNYFTGATAVAAPAVGTDALVGVSNDRGVHSMLRSAAGGPWPTTWSPVALGGVAQNRSAVVTTGGVSRVYIASQDGRVQAIDVTTGAVIWSTLLSPAAAQGAPAAIFTDFGGAWDYILVGTDASADTNRFYALDPADGSIVDYYPKAGSDTVVPMGPIPQMASVDYASRRVYFGLLSSNNADYSLLCLNLGPPTVDTLSFAWGLTRGEVDQIDTSPVLRGGRVYVGSANDNVWSIPADTGSFAGSYKKGLGDGGTKGFIFPDRRNGDLFLATNNKVRGLTDTGSALVDKWPDVSVKSASMVALWPGTNYLYVGSSDVGGNKAGLYELDVSLADPEPSAKFVALEASSLIVGAPALDIGYGLIHVGSEAGTFYAVEVPLP